MISAFGNLVLADTATEILSCSADAIASNAFAVPTQARLKVRIVLVAAGPVNPVSTTHQARNRRVNILISYGK